MEHYQASINFNASIAIEIFEDWPNLMVELISSLETNAQKVLNNNTEDISHLVDGPLLVIEMLLIDCGNAISKLNSNNECDKLFNALMFFAGNKQYSNQIRVRALNSLHTLYSYQPDCVTTNIEKLCQV